MRRLRTCGPLLALLVACSLPHHGLDGAAVGLRVDTGRSGMDAGYSETSPSQAPVRQEASFDTASIGVEAEFAGRHFALLASLRRHEVVALDGNLAVDDSFEELGLGMRGYLDLADGLRMFGEAGFVVLAGLDFGRAESPLGPRLGAGAVWQVSRNLSVEVRARYTVASIGSRDKDEFGNSFDRKFEADIDSFELGFGLTWWL